MICLLFSRPIGLIVDIGCGTGNITAKFAKEIDHVKCIAFDNSVDMIDFAIVHNNEWNISYKVGDICDDFDDLKSQLDLNEESADLIISIYCLHWIVNQEKAVENISNLLKPGNILILKNNYHLFLN